MDETKAPPGIERIPGWERFPWLRAGFSTRLGGLSHAYGEGNQNLGWTTEDDPAVVAANRAAFIQALGKGTTLPLVTVGQVHSAVVRDLDAEPSPPMGENGGARLEGDGMVSGSPGRLLGILTADCVPVLVADTRTHAVGAFHAGWRGTLGRIVEHGVAMLQARCGSDSADLIAAIGPCIHACCFNVGQDVRSGFVEKFAYGSELFQSNADRSLAMDLVAANRRQLLASGLHAENISTLEECTSCHRLPSGQRKYFSYRSERGVTGRMLSAIAAIA